MSEAQQAPQQKNSKQRSPRAPSISLEKAIELVQEVYQKEKRNVVSQEAVANDLGYNKLHGTARSTIAALKYYGLLEVENGGLVVSKSFENYKYNPDEKSKQKELSDLLKNPKVFAELLETFSSLPSLEAIRYELIKKGFKDTTAEETAQAFADSVGFVDYYEFHNSNDNDCEGSKEASKANDDLNMEDDNDSQVTDELAQSLRVNSQSSPAIEAGYEAIPIFLPKNRKAILQLQRPFTKNDKMVLLKQIEAMWLDDEEDFSS